MEASLPLIPMVWLSKEEYMNVFYFKYPPVHQPEYIWVKRQFPNAANQNQKRTIRTFWQ